MLWEPWALYVAAGLLILEQQYTKLCETPHDGRSGELDGAEWKLTQKGRGLFDTRSDGQVAQVHVAVPKWWDM